MCRCLIKSVLFLVNLLFTIVGIGLIAIGVIAIYQLRDVINQLPATVPFNIDVVPTVIIVIGVVIFLIAFSGCCGAATEAKCLLVTYAVFMAIFAAAKIVVTILLYVNLEGLTMEIETAVNETFVSADTNMNMTFHALEATLQCCGTTGPDSYVNDYNLAAPTCCEGGADVNLTNVKLCYKDQAFPTGCTTLLGRLFRSYMNSIGIGLIIVIVLEVLAMGGAIYIIKRGRNRTRPAPKNQNNFGNNGPLFQVNMISNTNNTTATRY